MKVLWQIPKTVVYTENIVLIVKKVGENLAKNYSGEEAILQAWINSAVHKKNLDDNWNIGCTVFNSNGYTSMIFGKK
jgi:uncharacterized protein YkwD